MTDLTAIPRLARSLARVVEIARTLVKYGLGDVLKKLDYNFVRRWTRDTEVARLSEVTREARIRLALTELGTTFIKFGQVLSTRRDVIGPALGEELEKLQSGVPADPFDVTRATLEAELKRPLAELFAEFDEVPLASASIGQVHRATLRDGRRVAVKVQHPGIARRIEDDTAILAELAALAERFVPELRTYRPVKLVAEFERTLTRELDFRRELRHLQLFRQAFARDPCVVFPEPLPALSTGRVLTMELLDGTPFNRPDELRAAGADFAALAQRGARVFLDMVFRDGFFHADPHPGNVLYLRPTLERPGGAIGLLDAGMVGRIDERLRERIERGVVAAISKDSVALTEQVVQVGEVPAHFDAAALQCEVADQLAFYHGMPLEQFQLGPALNEMTDAVRRYQVALPPTVALLLRMLVMLEGTGRTLSPAFNLTELLAPYQRTLVMKKLSPRRLLRRLGTAVEDWDELLRSLPRRAGTLFRMVQQDGVSVQLIHRHLEPSVNRLVFGMMVSALFVGSSLMWAFGAPPLVWGASAFGVAGCAASAVLGYRLYRAIQHTGRLEERDEGE
ncbi:ubiquinone biosynthesis protein : ABC-1 domain protein OS=Pirellula staleyi (strain ATCC 27377 / DSM 6068 / ICPB 4128) GN=Psta_3368 PE=4 SV=1: ABC1 [Gemmataceae bacterium]|nr:ubiquinone biosynthesis protein : ABC-1 domain protein OS=Pirellula staleyi (strain ATCC 27377 / DSM 6068 / ICPB 4128) GN=Psta_3368 PE=4 SV=1: ABC1 [Gemmataceae bacterium]VTT97154.1 ubiquinone biosynthesis protein : ABC-1 domain protein OS=Pirellula staleyi (strain ATCC 27377 / DSM 6068 / ICPB 4128) GN=Psta_3368 PE=4 SV=1: ABC1 [Gemmataceae bacterium]